MRSVLPLPPPTGEPVICDDDAESLTSTTNVRGLLSPQISTFGRRTCHRAVLKEALPKTVLMAEFKLDSPASTEVTHTHFDLRRMAIVSTLSLITSYSRSERKVWRSLWR